MKPGHSVALALVGWYAEAVDLKERFVQLHDWLAESTWNYLAQFSSNQKAMSVAIIGILFVIM